MSGAGSTLCLISLIEDFNANTSGCWQTKYWWASPFTQSPLIQARPPFTQTVKRWSVFGSEDRPLGLHCSASTVVNAGSYSNSLATTTDSNDRCLLYTSDAADERSSV